MAPVTGLVLEATLIGLGAGVIGTTAGGVIAVLISRPSRRLSSATLGFAGGVMLAIVAMTLFPEAIRRGGLLVTSAGFVLGVALIYALDLALPHAHASPKGGEGHEGRRRTDDVARFARTGLLISLGVALHNFPEGVAVGCGYIAGTTLGGAIIILIVIQNVPEGIAVAAPYLVAGRPKAKALALTALAGLPQGVGALVGAVAARVSPLVLALALAFAGGAMLFIVADELLPGARDLDQGHASAMGLVAGTLVGMVLTALLCGV